MTSPDTKKINPENSNTKNRLHPNKSEDNAIAPPKKLTLPHKVSDSNLDSSLSLQVEGTPFVIINKQLTRKTKRKDFTLAKRTEKNATPKIKNLKLIKTLEEIGKSKTAEKKSKK